jgi:hypothetical protein
MGGLVALAGLAFGAVMLALVFVGLVVRMILKLVFLPLLLIKWLVMGVVMLVVGPVLFVVGILVFLALSFVLAVPLLPLLGVAAIVLLLLKSSRRPAVV